MEMMMPNPSAILTFLRTNTRETLRVYWLLLRITVPLTLAAELLSRLGVIEAGKAG